ncbi:hypothetical protein I7I53_08286 [Histoplasma capsulatum var. duboisii H88]|uniref:Uncharacterized protein n=1 Tax=Ajellomyces capsulatus (strain H88) TaxID=544711 RepID=A0A8A1LJG2_AJEC8|nr:hypothetical protein I7I53_08286 [Histoplasma capsulatum var. duboisii H88]
MTDDARFDVSYKIQNANNVLCRRKRKSLTMPSHLLFYLDAKPYEEKKRVKKNAKSMSQYRNHLTPNHTTTPKNRKDKKGKASKRRNRTEIGSIMKKDA